MTAVKRGAYTIIFLVDVSSDVILEDNQRECEIFQDKLSKLEEENDELQKIRLKAQSQAIRIALINKVSNIIRESMDISVILSSALKELGIMFGCFRAYYASSADDGFCVKESFGENGFLKNSVINFDALVMKQLKPVRFQSAIHYLNILVLKLLNNQFYELLFRFFICKNDWGACFIELSKRELNEELEILEAISSQLGNAIIRAELYQKMQKRERFKSSIRRVKRDSTTTYKF